MPDIVIHCPNKIHEKPVSKFIDGKMTERVPNPKILFIAEEKSGGSFKVQCADNRCRKSTKSNGWFDIVLNGIGGYTVKSLPRQMFDLHKVPYVVGDDS